MEQKKNKTANASSTKVDDVNAVDKNTDAKAKEIADAKAQEEADAKAQEIADAKAKEIAAVMKTPLQLAQEEANKKRKAHEAELKAKEKKATIQKEENSDQEKPKKDNRPIFTTKDGLKYRFKKSAPKTLNIDNVSKKIADIIKDEEIMLELVYGNSNQIEQIY